MTECEPVRVVRLPGLDASPPRPPPTLPPWRYLLHRVLIENRDRLMPWEIALCEAVRGCKRPSASQQRKLWRLSDSLRRRGRGV